MAEYLKPYDINNFCISSSAVSTVSKQKAIDLSTKISHDVNFITNVQISQDYVYNLWKEHFDLSKYCCISSQNYIQMAITKAISFQNEFKTYAKLLYHAEDFRSEAKQKCSEQNTGIFCSLTYVTPILEMVLNLPDNKMQWTEEDTTKSNLVLLHINFLLKQYPNEFTFFQQNGFDYTEERKSEVASNVLNSILKLIQEANIEKLKTFRLELPIPSEYGIQLHDDCQTDKVCLFIKNIKEFDRYMVQVALYENSLVTNGRKRVLLNSETDYREFLKQLQLNRILEVLDEHHITSMTMANALKSHISTKFSQLKSYYEQIATFNAAIAKADIDFITTKLDKFKTNVQSVVDKFQDKMVALFIQLFIGAAVEVAEATVTLAMAVAEASNPLGWLLGGADPADLADTFAKFASALASLVEGTALTVAWANVKLKATEINSKFKENQDFLNNVKKLVVSNETQPGEGFKQTKDDFLANYTAYDPKVTADDIVDITANWIALSSAACDVIYGFQTTAGITAGGIVKGQNLCIDLPILAERMGGLYQNMFDFQFDLMDVLADQMRAQVAIDATKEIKTDLSSVSSDEPNSEETLNILQLLGGLTFTIYKTHLLETINRYCNILEYTAGGVRPSQCKGPNTDMIQLFSKSITPCTSQSYRYYTIPSTPTGPNDKVHISISELFNGATVNFKIPNSQWLVDHGWIKESEKDRALYVEKMEVYLPVATSNPTTFLVKADAILKNQVIAGSKSTEYMITPSVPLSTEYDMGPLRLYCPFVKIPNPYTSCEVDGGSSYICPSTLESARFDHSHHILHPSIYSQWAITIEGGEDLTPPESTTDINVIFGLKLCKLENDLSDLVHTEEVSSDCCPSGQYRPNITAVCTDCPPNSHSALAGYYCAKN